jgi:hypothetical protein
MYLRLITNEIHTADPFGDEISQRVARGRPSDVPEPWWLEVSAPLKRLRRQATQASLPLDTALALIVERELLRQDLARVGLSASALSELDDAAVRVRVDRQLTGADAIYLRCLLGRCPPPAQIALPSVGEPVCLSLPARLSTRVLQAGGLDALQLDEQLTLAINAETAALCCGQSMSEWVTWRLRAC